MLGTPAETPSRTPNVSVFKSEKELASRPPVTNRPPERSRVWSAGAVVLGCAIVGTAGWFAWHAARPSKVEAARTPPQGLAIFTSSPVGATILIDGTERGATPLQLPLAAGRYEVTIKSGDESRTLPLAVDPGATVSQYVELAVLPSTAGGRLEVGSDPAGAEVRLDGVVKGTTPLTITDAAPGTHKLTVSGDSVVNRTVSVTRGATTSVLVSTGATADAGAAGWLAIDAPFETEVYEGTELVGNSRSDRIMLPAGTHELRLTNAGLEFNGTRSVKIAAGKTATVAVALPDGKLSVNAVPWADVTIDGRGIGTTPLANLTVPVGTHDIVWRHPQLGERRQTVTVKAQTPTRVGVDFSK